MVRFSYGLSVGYILGDVAWTGYVEQKRGSGDELIKRQVSEAFVFQMIASLAMPTVVIHTAVHQTQNIIAGMTSPPTMLKKWGPSAVGFAIIPLLPLVDEPIEHLVENGFDTYWPSPDDWTRRHPRSSIFMTNWSNKES
jgi:hypothetical protein